MPNSITSILNDLYSCQGNNSFLWSTLLTSFNRDNSGEECVTFIKNKLSVCPNEELTLDILDYLMDNKVPSVVSLVGQKPFLNCLMELLKFENKTTMDVQKKTLYIIQKWAMMQENEPNKQIFKEFYSFLQSNGVFFPPKNDPTVVHYTYSKFINNQTEQFNNPFTQSNNNNPFNNQSNNNNDNPFTQSSNDNPFNQNYNNNNNPFTQNNNNDNPFTQSNNNSNPFNQSNDNPFNQSNNNNNPFTNNNNNPFTQNNNNNPFNNQHSNNNPFDSISNQFSYPSFEDSNNNKNNNLYDINGVYDINDINEGSNQNNTFQQQQHSFSQQSSYQPYQPQQQQKPSYSQNQPPPYLTKPNPYLTQSHPSLHQSNNSNAKQKILSYIEYEKIRKIVDEWLSKLTHINFMIDQGINSSYTNQLNQTIHELRSFQSELRNLIITYSNTIRGEEILRDLNDDIDTTLTRYNNLNSYQTPPKYISKIHSNIENSNFVYKDYPFYLKENDPSYRVDRQNKNTSSIFNKEKIKEDLSDFGSKVGSGASYVGQQVGKGATYVGEGLTNVGSKIKEHSINAFHRIKGSLRHDDIPSLPPPGSVNSSSSYSNNTLTKTYYYGEENRSIFGKMKSGLSSLGNKVKGAFD